MIRSVFFIDSRSGNNILTRTYSGLGFDPALLSGFFSALSSFASELFKKGLAEAGSVKKITGSVETYIEQISIKGYDLIYEIKNPIVLVAIIDKRDDEDVVRDGLKVLLEKFLEAHKEELKDLIVEVAVFRSFIPTIDKVLKNGKLGIICPTRKGAVPSMALSIGLINDLEYKVLESCTGELTVDEIAEKLGMKKLDLWKIIDRLKNNGLIELKTINI